ncbi:MULTISPECIES: phage tail assembly protein [unclassified Neisseria]|uniref:phage tail assembly protein n=1 Tax=unclassified Neisseria TaxID=2623750 RepID=UPI001071FA8F|nr:MULTISPECIES: phage tail assembly protein [unclassified Neisseria]MBF0802903.1 phage tail assembly protein [Neisseria sp. 19428wB4_WF04]TFU44438.1 phage tail assembly protein [Neisseria sp. WF04]
MNEAKQLQEKLGISQTIKLVEPITTPTGEVREITVRRVRVKDYKQAAERYPDNGALQQISVLAQASGLMEEDFENLTWADYKKLESFCIGH